MLMPDGVSCKATISACEKGNQWKAAPALLHGMVLQSMTPDAVSYSATISACKKGNQWSYSAALLLLHVMVDQLLMADAVTCNAAISAFEEGEVLGFKRVFLKEQERFGLSGVLGEEGRMVAGGGLRETDRGRAIGDSCRRMVACPVLGFFRRLACGALRL